MADKTHKTKPTAKQRKAVQLMAENGRSAHRAMLEAGYSPQTAVTPHKLTQSKGFLQVLDEVGITEEAISSYLAEDLQKKPQNRLGELTLAARLRGLLQERTDTTNVTAIQITFGEDKA